MAFNVKQHNVFYLSRIDDNHSGNVISLGVGSVETIAMDFQEYLAGTRAWLTAFDPVITVDSKGDDMGVSWNTAISESKYQLEWVPPTLGRGWYVISITVTANNGDEITGDGTLHVI